MSRASWLLLLVACGGGDDVRSDKGQTTPPDTDTTPPVTDTDTETTPPLPESCDAGTEAWVQRVLPFVLGRRAHGAHEVRMWAEIADTYGRDVAVRALTHDPGYARWWKPVLTDALYVARTGDKEYGSCFGAPKQATHDGTLTAFLHANPPDGANFGPKFNMADVILDALVADDLSVIWQAHLFARMNKPTTGANVSEEELEVSRRANFGSLFLDTYTNRDLVCVSCHNSEYSFTPDRTFGTPGHWEAALFENSGGRPVDEVYAMFKYHDVVAGFREDGRRPWGMDAACGEFNRPPAEDYLGQNSAYLIQAYAGDGSVWDVERAFADGVGAISGVGPNVAADLSVNGNDALAWLLAENIADQVWKLGMGSRLTIAYSYGRNPEQAERLTALAQRFVTAEWSLTELLVSVATDPYFNAGLPTTCETSPYGMAPIVDPYTVFDPDPARANNGPGELVHRHHARALLRGLEDALGWAPQDEFFGFFAASTDLELQGAVGVFLRESEPGFDGTDFQGLLAWEDRYAVCIQRGSPDDQLHRIYDDAVAANLTLGDAAAAVKDRLVAQGSFEPDEQVLVEALLGAPLTTPITDLDEAVAMKRLGLLCGAVVMSPDWMLSVEPLPIGPTPALADVQPDCDNLIAAMAAVGETVSCP